MYQISSTSHKNGSETIHVFPLSGGDCLKFGDVVFAVAWLTVFLSVISFLLTLMLTPALGSYNAFELSGFVSIILGSIIVGYICAQKIWEENRTRTIANIAVLFAVLAMFMVLVKDSIAEWGPYIRAEYLKANPPLHRQHSTGTTSN